MGWKQCILRPALCVVMTVLVGPAAAAQAGFSYRGICDASAAVALGAEHFVVADDERNTLRIFQRNNPDAVGEVDLREFLGTKKGRESDLEGAAVIGQRIYWIASHGRNSKGKERPERYRFFATDIVSGKSPTVVPVGSVYTGLLRDLAGAAHLNSAGLAQAAARAPEDEGGLNIEGLAASAEGKLLIGFRSPVPGGRALIVPLENPEGIIRGEAARLGAPVLLDLAGRGIRSIELLGSAHIVAAGPAADSGAFALYRWSGASREDKPVKLGNIDLSDLRPEALFAIPGGRQMQILSDDGGVQAGGMPCKDQKPSRQSFRSLVIELAP